MMKKRPINLLLQKELLIAQGEVLRLRCQSAWDNYQHPSVSWAGKIWHAFYTNSLGTLLIIKTLLSQGFSQQPTKRIIKTIWHLIWLVRACKKIWQHRSS